MRNSNLINVNHLKKYQKFWGKSLDREPVEHTLASRGGNREAVSRVWPQVGPVKSGRAESSGEE